jgi:cytochrome c peroxidase
VACEPEPDASGVEPADTAEVLSARVELGRALFYDPILSADGETACATCHSEHWGMGDGLPLAIGVGAGDLVGPGRQGAAVGRRNAPTLWNAAARGELFWDGRASSLEEQARLPFESDVELDLPLGDALAAVEGVAEYGELFGAAFPDRQAAITAQTLTAALAEFQRTLVSDHAPYDAYLAGDTAALSARMLEGLALLEELGCDGCHSPPLFQSDRYARRLPSREGVDEGVVEADALDLGRYEVTGAPEDREAFRVPTLRNVRDTAPYFHDGSVATLREAVAHEVTVQVGSGHRSPDEAEIDALTELIAKGLLDLSHNPDRPDRVPSGLPLPRDGFRIVR